MNQKLQVKDKRTMLFAVLATAFTFSSSSLTLSAQDRKENPAHRVDCGRGKPGLAKTVAHAKPGDTILISGICREKVRITEGPLTLDPGGSAVLQGEGLAFQVFQQPMIGIDEAQGVVIKNLRIEDWPDAATSVGNGSAARLENVTLRENTIGLLLYANSTAEVVDSFLEANFVGIDIVGASSLVLRGNVRVNRNLYNGFDVTGNSAIEIRGAKVEANDNGNRGVILNDSQLFILAYPPSAGSLLTANRNVLDGVTLTGTATLGLFGDSATGAGVIASDNREHGILVTGGQIMSLASNRIVTTGNPTGIRLEAGADATIVGGLELRNNRTGLQADGADVIELQPPLPGASPSAISGNSTADLDLRFGSRIRVSPGVVVGKVTCADKTVLAVGVSCP